MTWSDADVVAEQKQEWSDGDVASILPVSSQPSLNVPFSTRAGLSVKITPQGKQGYLESKYGKGNVFRNGDGEFFVKDQSGQVSAVDPEGFESGDIADFADVATELAPMVGAAVATRGAAVPAMANPIGASLAAGGGRAARQAVSEMLPGQENFSVMGSNNAFGRVADVGTQMALAGMFQKATNTISSLIDKVRPGNLIAGKMRSDLSNQSSQQAMNEEALVQKLTGNRNFAFTPGQASQSRGTLTVEGMARRHPVSADMVDAFDQEQTDTMVKAFEKSRDSVFPYSNNEIVGNAVESSFMGKLKTLKDTRRNNATKAFDLVDKLNQGKPVFGTDSTTQAIDDLIAKYDSPQTPTNLKGIVNQLRQLRQTFSDNSQSAILGPNGQPLAKPVMLKAQEMQNLLQTYGKGAKSGDIFGLNDKAQSQFLSGEIYRALQRDLDNVAPGIDQATATALKMARKGYADDTAPIQAMKDSTLGRVLGGNAEVVPENIVNKFFNMQPSQIKSNMKNLDIGTQKQIQAAYIDSWLQAGRDISGSAQRVSGAQFSPSKALSAIDDQKMAAIFQNDPGALMQLKTLRSALQRINDRAGTGGSPTAPLQQAYEVAKGLLTSDPRASVRAVAAIMAPRHVAYAMTTPEGRLALVQMTRTKPGTKLAEGTLIRLMSSAGLTYPDPETQDQQQLQR